MSHEFDLSQATMLPPAPTGPRPLPEVGMLTEQWEAVHEAAAAVAGLAQLESGSADAALLALPRRAAEMGGWHFEMAARGIEDLAAIMQPGLRALLALTAQGSDTTVAALTLWREFHSARAAILELVDAA